ncbi:MAG: hypothetical protein ACLFRL_07210 [Desulfohalobiaceae bacterium]
MSSCLQGLQGRYRIFFHAGKKSLQDAGWQETEAEYQARQRAWLQRKDLKRKTGTSKDE